MECLHVCFYNWSPLVYQQEEGEWSQVHYMPQPNAMQSLFLRPLHSLKQQYVDIIFFLQGDAPGNDSSFNISSMTAFSPRIAASTKRGIEGELEGTARGAAGCMTLREKQRLKLAFVCSVWLVRLASTRLHNNNLLPPFHFFSTLPSIFLLSLKENSLIRWFLSSWCDERHL